MAASQLRHKTPGWGQSCLHNRVPQTVECDLCDNGLQHGQNLRMVAKVEALHEVYEAADGMAAVIVTKHQSLVQLFASKKPRGARPICS